MKTLMKISAMGGVFCMVSVFPGQAAFGFSCDGMIVSPGDTKMEVLMKCGEPALRDSHEEKLTERLDETAKIKTTVIVEEWTYNFGPQSFLRIMEFRNGKLADIRTGGYGYADAKERATICDEQKIQRGDMKLDVLVQCGEPALKEERKEEIIEETDQDTKRKVTLIIEEWTYNLGPNRFMRVFTFRNGRVIDIRTGNYGK